MFLFILSLFFSLHPSTASLSPRSKELATKWAPRVWLHQDEKFFPSTVDFHLKNVETRDNDENVRADAPLLPSTVPTGQETETWHLNTVKDLECVNCFEDFFSGQSVDQVPSYAFVTEHADACDTVDVTYSLFYPFNYGKDVCVGIDTGSGCLGEWKTFGNHVGDWEHVSLRLQRGQPVEMYLGVHSFGAWYLWNAVTGKFEFSRGEELKRKTRTRSGRLLDMRMEVEYPQEVSLEAGHPAVFSANGSHGVWAQEGKHTYLHILTVHLDDFCGRGTAWDTWKNLEFIETGDWDSFPADLSWVDFRGDWGNQLKMGCQLEPLFGECGVVGGPSGPHKYFQHDMEQPPFCP